MMNRYAPMSEHSKVDTVYILKTTINISSKLMSIISYNMLHNYLIAILKVLIITFDPTSMNGSLHFLLSCISKKKSEQKVAF